MSDEQPMDRLSFLKQAFGEHASKFEDNLNKIAQNNFEAYKHKLATSAGIYESRQQLAKAIPQFWFNALKNCRSTATFLDPVDEEALSHLQDVWIEHDKEDPRNWEIKFTFGAKNPSFKETTLTRSFSITPPTSSPSHPTPSPYDLEADVFLLPCPTRITWTSPEHDLTKKAPRSNPTELEEYDEFGGPGSFFHLFGEAQDGEDEIGMAETLLEWWGHATEYAAGLTAIDDDDSDDGMFPGGFGGSDDEDSDDDPTKEIDLGSEEEEERPKKKGRKN